MTNKKYLELLYSFNHSFDDSSPLIIEWKNGLKVKCNSITGMYETDTEPGDDDYIGEYAAAVGDVEILRQGNDNSVEIYNDCIEISLKCIPERVSLESGIVLWEREVNDFDNNFYDEYDLIDCLNRGCEVEFLYNEKMYSITHSDNKIIVTEFYNEDSEKTYPDALTALSYEIDGKPLRDIISKMKVVDRAF